MTLPTWITAAGPCVGCNMPSVECANPATTSTCCSMCEHPTPHAAHLAAQRPTPAPTEES